MKIGIIHIVFFVFITSTVIEGAVNNDDRNEIITGFGEPTLGFLTDPNQSEKLKVFPNPANVQVTFEFVAKQQSTLRVYDILGNQITDLSSKISIGNNSFIWSVSDLKPGMYMCVLTEGTISTTVKLLVTE